MDREKRTSFEKVADIYEERRSGYPDEVIEDIVKLSKIAFGGKILEIGCGPGNATVPFAKRGYEILGIELGERLAAIAAQNCRKYPGVKIKNMAFEDWDCEERSFDLAIAADAFHWIPPKIGYPKVARALKDTGSVAFFWKVPIESETELSRTIDKVFQETGPEFINPDKRFTAKWLEEIVTASFEKSGHFENVVTKQYFWPTILTTKDYINDLRTFSMHDGINNEKREHLYKEIEEVIERYGGKMEKQTSVMLFHSKVKR